MSDDQYDLQALCMIIHLQHCHLPSERDPMAFLSHAARILLEPRSQYRDGERALVQEGARDV